MEYIRIIKNTIILNLKKVVSLGKWKLVSWQNVHKTVKFFVRKGGLLYLNKNNIMERYGNIYVGENAKLSIGSHNYFNQGLIISCQDSIVIGDNCLFGPNVLIYDNDHQFFKNKGVSFAYNSKKITIGNNCWVAANVIILKGSKIGNNCVIGANTVVSGVIPDNSIVKQNRNTEIKQMRDIL